MKRIKLEEETKEVSVIEEIEETVQPEVPPILISRAKTVMKPEEIESRYQAFLEKIKRGGK